MIDAATKAVIADIHARRGAIGEQIAALRKEDAELEITLKVLRDIYKLDAPSRSNRDVSTDGEPSPEAGPKAEASLAGMLSGREGHHGEGGAHTSEAVATEGRRSAPPAHAMVDAATLRPLTEKQAATFEALRRACNEGSRPTLSLIAEYAGLTASANAIYQLEALRRYGYADNFGDRGAPDWRPTAFGEVTVVADRDRAQPWTEGQIIELRALDPAKGDSYAQFAAKCDRTPAAVEQQARNMRCYRRELGNMRAKTRALKSKRRFTDHADPDPDSVRGLKPDNPAVLEGRTMFPSTVVNPADSPALLVSGANSRKLGDRVTKGKWAGFPIFQLSLEERATCPKSCHHWLTCYGNGMPQARRHRHGPELVNYLRAELTDLQEDHPKGFVVRLHVLGDFYSLDYVRAWQGFLDTFPALHIFGYTAWPKDSEIGAAILGLTESRWDRFAVRFSSAAVESQGATALWRKPEDLTDWPGIICPAQTGKTDCCGTCALCWAESAKDKTIGFIAHGRVGAPKRAAPVKHPPKDRLSPDAAALLKKPARAYPKITGPMTTIVRRLPTQAAALKSAPPTNLNDAAAAKAIADYMATRGVRRFEDGASTAAWHLCEWLAHRGYDVCQNTGAGSNGRPFKIKGKAVSKDEFLALVDKVRAKENLPPIGRAA